MALNTYQRQDRPRVPHYPGARGFTLVDMAIALLVVGLLAAPAIHAYNLWRVKKGNGDTYENFYAVKKALADFYYANDRYPCPALLNRNNTNPDYGQENCGTTAAGGTLAGGLPFAALKIPSSLTLDGWSNKLTYVVTQTQTVAPMDPNGGAITVMEFDNDPLTGCQSSQHFIANNNGHFVLVSHGPLGIGAYNANGVPVQACGTGGGTTRETENCDYAANDTFLYQSCAKSDDMLGGNYYDDLLDYQASVPDLIWNYIPTDPDDIFTNAVNVGINNRNPQTGLDVVGNIRTQVNTADPVDNPGNINVDQICDSAGNNCMPVDTITGNDLRMRCSGPGAVTAIGGNAVNCNITYDPGVSGDCADGEYVVGINAGGIVCAAPPP